MEQDQDKFALVTGSSSGLGLESCQYLLDEGYIVFGLSRSGSPIEHERYVDLQVDLREEESMAQIGDALEDEVFGLEVIVHCAGVFDLLSVEQMSSDIFLDHFQTNVLGTFHLLKAIQGFLLNGESHFIQVSSYASDKGLPNLSAYCGSKAALDNLIASTRQEWKELGMRFSTLAPGELDTPLWDNLSESEFRPQKVLSCDDFLYVLDFLVKSPPYIEFPRLEFSHTQAGAIV